MRLVKQLVLKYVRAKFKLLSSISKRKAAAEAFELFCTPQYRNKKDLPLIFQKAEQLSFPFETYTVRGYRWMPNRMDYAGGGPPAEKKVLILHGFESSVINFEKYIHPLIKKGYEVLAFDAPAHGRSTGKKITVVTYKNLIHYIWQQYGPIGAFIAHSFGGLTVSLALEEIFHSQETKIVLIAPAAETTTAIDNFFKILRLDKGVRKEFDQLIQEMSGKPPEWFSVSRAAPHLKAQVLFLQDKDDHMTPLSDVKPIIDKNYPNFRFVISKGLGHRKIYRDNQSLKKIMEFL